MTLTLPSILFGIVLAVLFGAMFHLLRGGNAQRLLMYLLLAQVGFWGGHFLGEYLDLTFAPVGPLLFGMAAIGSILVLVIGDLISRISVSPGE
jgi:uncharacterized membrane protein YeaQ/YmgE (transglycosylase-associated protein family)